MVEKTTEIFIAYARNDKQFQSELDNHLSSLKRNEELYVFSDGEIVPGQQWSAEIQYHLNRASIILLLISSDFLSSRYCVEVEMASAMQRRAEGTAIVIPILIRPVDWKSEKALNHLQVLPSTARPVSKWKNRDDAWVNVVRGIQVAIGKLSEPTLRSLASRSISRCLMPFASISYEILTGIESASCVWLLSRTGQGWWKDFHDEFQTLWGNDLKEKNRLLLLDPDCDAFNLALNHEWKKAPWKQKATPVTYKKDAKKFQVMLDEMSVPLRRINILVPLVLLIIYPREQGQDKPTMFVEYPTFLSSYQSKPFLKVTPEDRIYFDGFRNVFQDLWDRYGR